MSPAEDNDQVMDQLEKALANLHLIRRGVDKGLDRNPGTGRLGTRGVTRGRTELLKCYDHIDHLHDALESVMYAHSRGRHMGFELSRRRAAALATNERLGLARVQNDGKFRIGQDVKIHHEQDTKYDKHHGTVVGTTRSYVYVQILLHAADGEVVRKRNDKVVRDTESPYYTNED